MGLRGEREEGSLIRSLQQMNMTIGCQKRDFLHPMDGDLAAVAWKVSEREKGVSIPPLMVVVVLIVGIKKGRWEWDYEW